MRFQVPQFIDFEDKIFGPFTLKQFIYLAGGAGMIIVFFSVFPRFIALVLAVPIAIFAAALAFYKVNNKPFIEMVEAFLKFSMNKRLYIWQKKDKPAESTEFKVREKDELYVPKLSDSRLKDLNWSLDVKKEEQYQTGGDRSVGI